MYKDKTGAFKMKKFFIIFILIINLISFSEFLWSVQTGDSISSSPAIDSTGNVYFTSQDGYLYSLNNKGEFNWVFKTDEILINSPTIGFDGNVYFGQENLYSVDTKTGFMNWSLKIGNITTSPAIDSDGNIYIGDEEGYIYAISKYGYIKWDFLTNGFILVLKMVFFTQ
jgi:outer membrane protein assembly factor BamB